MIKRINWNKANPIEAESPFQFPFSRFDEYKERPLRIFFHVSSHDNLSTEEREALNKLVDLSQNSEIEAINTEKGKLPYIEFSPYETGDRNVSYSIYHNNSIRHGGIHVGQELLPMLVVSKSSTEAQYELTEKDLLTLKACMQLHQDIFVTSSQAILNNITVPFVADQNPMLPSEALNIVGLLLRSKGKYTYEYPLFLTKGSYYLGTANSLLPDLWYYLSICGESEAIRKDDIVYLSQSILDRCIRTLMALDEIGYKFYVSQNNDTIDNIMYHFDYITILLMGALDAEACVAYRAYQLQKPKSERYVGFKNEDFLRALENTKGNLWRIIETSNLKDVIGIVSLLRNTIHSTRMSPIAYQKLFELSESFARLPNKIANDLFINCIKFGSKEEWGFFTLGDILCIEPYTFARKLVPLTFDSINSIARQTDLEGLFIDGSPIPNIVDDRARYDDYSSVK